MSEYQRYEFITRDRPLARAELEAVNALSSHIDASSTHALIEYHWSGFKHNPIKVLHQFFDGFLYWANWGAPELALRFPHGVLPAELLEGYDLEEFVTFTQHPDYDILDMHFGEVEAPDTWVDYELGSLIALREELMAGDLRALYITWLASQCLIGSEDDQEDEEIIGAPPVPPAFGVLTAAQQALAELWQVPQELLVAAERHSSPAPGAPDDPFDVWVELLPPARCKDYLVRLARNEPGLGRLLVKELRSLGQGQTSVVPSTGESVTFARLFAESQAIKAAWEREQREQEQLARELHLQAIHDHQDEYWQRVELAVTRQSGPGYDEAVQLLSELREVAGHYKEGEAFQARFGTWVRPHLRRPAFVKRLHDRRFTLPEA